MAAVGKLYDHAEARYLEYAHCLLGLIYANHKQLRYPLKFELYRKEEDCTKEVHHPVVGYYPTGESS